MTGAVSFVRIPAAWRLPLCFALGAAVAFLIVLWGALALESALARPAILTGWVLAAALAGLSLLNARKKLSMVPVGTARSWLLLHVVGGFLAVALFWLHTRSLWPNGFYEQILAALFYLVSASGILGYVLERVYPKRLTETGVEIIFERIPAEIASLREKAEAVLIKATEETGADTLARHYIARLGWYFARPRFFWSHATGGDAGRRYVGAECGLVARYVNDAEKPHLDALADLARRKTAVDRHYALQKILKTWLFFHVPAAMALVAMMLWHIVLVHVYAI